MRAIATFIKEVGYHLSIPSAPYHPDYPFPRSLSSRFVRAPPASFSLLSSVHLCASPSSRASLRADPARHALYVRFVPLLPLFCMPVSGA